jgi:hypothetical protein
MDPLRAEERDLHLAAAAAQNRQEALVRREPNIAAVHLLDRVDQATRVPDLERAGLRVGDRQ